jgi:hypothetical protein
VDGHALLAQPRAGPEDLVERADLEGEVVQAAALAPGGAPHEGDAVMVGVDPEEDHAAGHHGVRIAIAHPEPEHAGVEGHRAVQIGDVEHDVADLPELELHRRGVYRQAGVDGSRACRAFRKVTGAMIVASFTTLPAVAGEDAHSCRR